MNEEKVEIIRNRYGIPFHYYGDKVRVLFICSAVLMVVMLPFFNDRLPVPAFISIIAIVFLSLISGFLAPRKKWLIYINPIIASIGLIVFEHQAIKIYNSTDLLFWCDHALAVIFLFALYYSAKTIRSL